MQKSVLNDRMVIKFDSGEDLFEGLWSALLEYNDCGWCVLIGIGMLEDAEIGYFDGKEYHKKTLSEPHELVALHGTVTTYGDFAPHLHCGLVGPDHKLVGGHLFKAKVKVVCEMVLLKLDTPMTRKKDPATGLNLLSLE